jgi:hypothetical protein
MGESSGVGLVELAILDALDARRAWPNRRYVNCLKVLLALENEIGLARGYGHQVLIDIAVPWRLPIPLVQPQGNFGGQGNDPPASPYYTRARLSPVGQVVLAAGQRTELGLQARATVSDTAQINADRGSPFRRGTNLPVVVLDKFAPYANPDELIYGIDDRVRSHPWQARYPELGDQTGLPIKRMTDISSDRYGFCHVYVPADGMSAEELRDRLLKVRGVTYYISVGLPKPLATMIRTWARANQVKDLHASLAALEAALPSQYQKT